MNIFVKHKGFVSDAVSEFVPELVIDKVASRLFAKDHTLWGKEAEDESKIRLGWVEAAEESLVLLSEIQELRSQLVQQGINRFVLCGMGGSSLAPEVITKTFGKELVILDSTDPSQVHQTVSQFIEKTVVIVSSKSGSTVETDSQKRSFEQAFTNSGIDPRQRIIIVTDPESPMHKKALEDGYRVFLANPTVGGRYSALTAFGVVPCTLAGVDMEPVLQGAVSAKAELEIDSESNPGLVLGAAIAKSRGPNGLRDKLGFVPEKSPILGFGDWIEQLIAESTGKNGRGLLPIVLDEDSPEEQCNHDDVLLIGLSGDAKTSRFDLAVSGDLGGQLLLWEVATAVASRLLGVNPFDQPDVESAKIAARALLESPATETDSGFADNDVSVLTYGFDPPNQTLESAVQAFLDSADHRSYVSIQCYLNRNDFTEASLLRGLVARKLNRPTTFGWGPRFLHSTGQYHKGGPKTGLFLQIVNAGGFDESIPGRNFGYRELIESQSNGDAQVLARNGCKVLVVRLGDVKSGLARLSAAIGR